MYIVLLIELDLKRNIKIHLFMIKELSKKILKTNIIT